MHHTMGIIAASFVILLASSIISIASTREKAYCDQTIAERKLNPTTCHFIQRDANGTPITYVFKPCPFVPDIGAM